MPKAEPFWTRRSVAASFGLLVLFLLLLYLEGRPAWCETGPALWAAAWTTCTSQNFLDPYSFTHVLHGVIFFWLLRPLSDRVSLPWRLVAAITLEIGWEVLENSPWVIERYRQDTASLDYTGDSVLNSLGDVVSVVAGFLVAARFPWQVSAALFAVIELALLFFVRDNLTLNVLMLVSPSDAIRNWQLSGLGIPLPSP
ncbi:MAG: DUF2585 family protein [Pirellulales bacterium]